MSTTIQRSQQIDFASQALPELFHASPYDFMKYLGRDGTKFLRFYWDEVGKKIAETERITNTFGLNFEIRRPRSRVTIALISLPKPRFEREAYYVAMIHRPYRVTFFGISDTTKALCLESAQDLNGNERPLLVEWSRKMVRESLHTLPVADREAFYAAVLEEIKE